MQALLNFFDIANLVPHGYCLSWGSVLLWLHVSADLLITLSYYSIPLSLAYFVQKRQDLPYPWLVLMFALFIVACGTTHLIAIITIWLPVYWLEAYVKIFTALVSIASAGAIFWVIPLVLKLPSPAQLQAEIKHRQQIDKARQQALDRLQKIASRLPGMVYAFRLSPNGQFSFPYCSEGVLDIFRLRPEQVYANTRQLLMLVHRDDRKALLKSIYLSAAQLSAWQSEFRVLFADGTLCWLTGNATAEREADGSILWHGFVTDVTERKHVEREILATRNQLQATIEAIPDFLFELDIDGHYYDYHSLTLQETAAHANAQQTIFDVLPPEAANICLAAMHEAAQQGKSVGRQFKLEGTGATCWFELSVALRAGLNPQALRFVVLSRDITERKMMEDALKASEAQFRAIIDMSPVPMALNDAEQRINFVNSAFVETFGYQLADIPTVAAWAEKAYPAPAYRDWVLNSCKTRLQQAKHHHKAFTPLEVTVQCQDGSLKTILASATALSHSGENLYLKILYDITERKQAETESRIAAIAFESQEAMVITDANSIILRVNAAFSQTTGYSAQEAIGQPMNLLQSGRHDEAFYQAMWDSIQTQGSWQGEIWDRRKNGEIYPKWLTITAVVGDDGKVSHYVGTHTDITTRKATEEYINRLAFYDQLTQLPNRRLLQERLKHGIEFSRRTGSQMAVLMLDLDRFKHVNDTLGHTAGDKLLRQVAGRLKACLREIDTVARLGGDEFVILMEDISHYKNVARVAEAIIYSISQPFILNKHNAVHIGVSIGIAICPSHGDEVDTLMDNADTALYYAKDQGRGCFAYFSESLTLKARQRLALEAKLRKAIEQDEFCLYFQPQIDLKTGNIVGAEALVRWRNPQNGDITTPKDFIPLAEETGLIVNIGQWVLHETCTLGKRWLEAGLPVISLAVNVSPYQFRRHDINKLVAQVLHDTQFPAHYLELEITESGLMDNQHATQILINLHQQGVRLAIDDFGTGYSSLAYLKYFPIDVLKIDKTFIDDIPLSEGDMAITATIIAMAHHLGFKVLAEGVETQAQLDFLHAQGCDSYQGYFYSQPLTADKFAQLLETGAISL